MGQIFNRIRRIAKTYIDDIPSPVRQGQNVNDEDEELKRIIDELNREKSERQEPRDHQSKERSHGQMSAEKAYSILGINPGSGIEEIKSAYKKRIKEYHPDRVASLGDELKTLAANKTLEINKAYEFLKKTRNF